MSHGQRGEDIVYRCSVCRRALSAEQVRLRAVCSSCAGRQKMRRRSVAAASAEDRVTIGNLVRRFWGEEEQLAFGKEYVVSELPALTVKSGKRVVGFLSFAEMETDLLIVALGVLPRYQNTGVATGLVAKAELEANKRGKRRLLVSTSNDDLPALAFYQAMGFRIFDVISDVIAKKHGQILRGIGGLPIRDELRLQKTLQ